jgi:hypothetical protein
MPIAPSPFYRLCRRWRHSSFLPLGGYRPFIRHSFYVPHRRRIGGDLGRIIARWR